MVEFEQCRDEALRREMVSRIDRAILEDGTCSPLDGLRIFRTSSPTDCISGVSQLSLCVIAQGSKEVYLGTSRYEYNADRYLLATMELPITARIFDATPQKPYLSLILSLDTVLVGSVMAEAGLPVPHAQSEAKAMVVSRLDPGLRDALVRLLRLMDSPSDARMLLPMLKREIVYRLLQGEQRSRLRHLPSAAEHTNRIATAVEKLRKEFDQPLSIDGIARDLGMSPSAFYQHFRSVTEMSPLQFQKQVRLQEARRLMVGESLDASSAGYRVGYDDPSHFSRDYKRLFGAPPAKDAERLRTMAVAD